MHDTTKLKKRGAIISAAVCGVITLLYIAVIAFALSGEDSESTLVWIFTGVYLFAMGAVLIGVMAALRQRLKEIEGGEEDAARIY